MKQEEIRKKAEKIMADIGQNDLLSDYEITTGVAIRIVEWSNKKVTDGACRWLKNHINDYFTKGRDINYIVDDLRKELEKYKIDDYRKDI